MPSRPPIPYPVLTIPPGPGGSGANGLTESQVKALLSLKKSDRSVTAAFTLSTADGVVTIGQNDGDEIVGTLSPISTYGTGRTFVIVNTGSNQAHLNATGGANVYNIASAPASPPGYDMAPESSIIITTTSGGWRVIHDSSLSGGDIGPSGGDVIVSVVAPPEPTDPSSAVWVRIDPALVFVDFRGLRDGGPQSVTTDGEFGIIDLNDVHDTNPSVASATEIVSGVARPELGEPSRSIMQVDVEAPLSIPWGIGYRHGGISETDTPIGPGEDTTVNITHTDVDGNGPVVHCHTVDLGFIGGSGVGSYLAIGWDIDNAAVLDFDPGNGRIALFPETRQVHELDQITLLHPEHGLFQGLLNGEVLVEWTTDYDIVDGDEICHVTRPDTSEIVDINMSDLGSVSWPANSISTDGESWRNGYAWLAIYDASESVVYNPDAFPVRRWNTTLGEWVETARQLSIDAVRFLLGQ